MKRTSLAICAIMAGCSYAPQAEVREEPVATVAEAGPGSLLLRSALLFEETGQTLIEPKIVGGREAQPGENPWQVALVAGSRTDKNVVFCGGSAIGPTWILTAAHCVDEGTAPAQVDVVSGTVDLDQGGRRTRVAQIIIHPGWNPSTHDNDVALLRLADAAMAQPIALVTAASEAPLVNPGSLVRVTGWGSAQQGAFTVRRLRTVDVPIVSSTDCNDRVSYNGAISNNMICAGWQRGGADSCQGDSGGPLTAPSANGRILIGVVSWGRGCAQPNKYGIYTRLASYSQWIGECISSRPCRPS
jgi:secreted trypsin-like serine protease